MLDLSTLQQFESGLDPRDPTSSLIPCKILGYGEISCVLEINNDSEIAAKRMPLFTSISAAEKYAEAYKKYCERLRAAGLLIPEDSTTIVQGHGDIAVLYILQKQLPPSRFCHKLIHTEDPDSLKIMIQMIVGEIEKVWTYNSENDPDIRLAIDGQLSNWVLLESGEMAYIDTSTPLMLENGTETLDPELLLQSAPSFLRWLIRWLFLEDVMTRYYDRKLVYTDLIANLYKEQRPEIVDSWIKSINESSRDNMDVLDRQAIEAYYKEDKLIWRLFLGLRRIDRFIKSKLFGQRYEFVLPGNIKR
ncbi:MAG: hypothetical protein HN995_13955 [Candidatus Marinimicrobia bacterium]|jgi:hypothetical protein|nr:hypothetical protein [Candidatus Neomarinimicrobiota bacterium]MBT3575560.1 hypothetical protein [Candidatus Neomarinimicrobiota bacterium]MBT3679657.1 hypothetical protein [Candidatus Neomarinimicrobiota bacterium]MBT3950614.1 hypothetical protein [Candidatus Neomarinimicrobiota bacterium]MBT4253399.1 hypothetical protein [Candidatus Neomarinimicrobiota bacterium]